MPDAARINFPRMRRQSRERCFAAMRDNDVDVLLLGREANSRYAAGARRLWFSGTRPYAPGCVLIRRDEQLYLLSPWDDGVPEEIPRDHLYGLTWNPMNLFDIIRAMPGMSEARRVGVDEISPLFRQLFSTAMPGAELVDCGAMLRDVRLRKSEDEVRCIETAVAIAESSLVESMSLLRPGIREQDLKGAFEYQMSQLGVTTPGMEGTFCATQRVEDSPAALRRLTSNRIIDGSSPVAMAGSVLYAGYEGVVGRTVAGDRQQPSECWMHLRSRGVELWQRLIDACRPGRTGADLTAVYRDADESLPDFPIAYSIGLGYEMPVAGSAMGTDFDRKRRLIPGMVLLVQAVARGAAGGFLTADTLRITEDGPELLTSLGPMLDDMRRADARA